MDDVVYMLGIVAAVFAVNYGLRVLPFLLFGGRDRELPLWVLRFGRYISPVIIAALVVYAYSGLQWRTAWPYVAGAVTVALHLWKGNALASIVVGTIVYMCLINCGCTTRQVCVLDGRDPDVRVSTQGVLFDDRFVQPTEVAEILEDNDIPRDRTIHILLDPDVKDLREARFLMACLARAGYKRPILVTKQHGESFSLGRKPSRSVAPRQSAPAAAPRQIRYKRASE